METLGNQYPIGWSIEKYRAVNQGSRLNLPNGIRNTIRIFGKIPEGIDLKYILETSRIDLNSEESCDIIIHHPGVRCLVIGSNDDREISYEFGIQKNDTTLVVATKIHEKLSSIINEG